MLHVAKERIQKTMSNPYNIGFIDRSLRFIAGGMMLGSIIYLSSSVMVSIIGLEIMLMKLLALLSIYPLLTAWIGWDPVYHMLSINSATKIKEDICGDIVDQVKTATHMES
jgi:hypothetical protein